MVRISISNKFLAYVKRLKQIIKNELMSIDGTKEIAFYVATFAQKNT